ncbi:MAG: ABC transporter ATP-binding protein [Gemmatimonadota bacterium]|nr:MAG: ABC transporter ATP-binding protein [Gemmatimonadota bacterium]
MTPGSPIEESYNRRFDFEVWKKLFGYTRPYRREVLLLIMFAVLTATADALIPLVTRELVDEIVERGSDVRLARYLWAFFGLTTVISVAVWRFIWLAGKIRTHVSHDIRRDGFENLQRLSFSFFDHRPVGWLMARMTSDCERLSNIMAWGILDIFWGTTLMTTIAVAMFLMNARLALVVLAVIPVLAWVSAQFQRRILKSARKVRKTNSRITASINEAIMGVRTTKVFAREQENLADFRGLTTEMFSASVRNALQSALYLPIAVSLGAVAAAVALNLGGLDMAAGTITVGTLMAFMAYTRHFFDPIQEMAHWFAEMQMAQASAERVMGLVEAVPEIQDSPEVRAAIASHRTRTSADPSLAADGGPTGFETIRFDHVDFRYETGDPVLHDLDLEVRAGETIALVGPTGGGKTTLVSLLCRFYEPTKGRVLFDGTDYRERSLSWLQSQLGIVLQTPHLFSGSVAENIRYGRLDASPDAVEQAARLVGAHEFVTGMEHGYQSEVGEGGNRLSTGQKQLISFARAILAQPRILIMDEATSSVDTETERRIQDGVAKVLEGRTSFVIAHRLSTIRSADRILVIDGGKIREQGSHAELLARGGRYHELFIQQSRLDVGRGTTWDEGGPEAWSPGPA